LRTPKSFALLVARFRFLNPRLISHGCGVWCRLRRSYVCLALFNPARFTQRDGSTGLFNFFASGRTDFVGLHFEVVLQFAFAEDFDPGKMTSYEIRLAQKLFIYNCAGL